MTGPAFLLGVIVAAGVCLAALTWIVVDTIRTQRYTQALWAYTDECNAHAARMNAAALAHLAGIENEDTAWHQSRPPDPVRPTMPGPTWPSRKPLVPADD